MEKAKHTPGPWFQKPARTLTHIHSVNGWMIGSLPLGSAEAEANARLIEAAPELLAYAECEEARLTGDMSVLFKHGYIKNTPPLEFIDQLRKAAIAKATGGDHGIS